MNDENIVGFIGLAEYYNCRPSAFISADEYTKFCFDEACAYIKMQMKDKKRPKFGNTKKIKQNYTSFKKFYDDVLN